MYIARSSQAVLPLLAATGIHVRAVAFDEAHLVMEWGSGFRPLYPLLAPLIDLLPGTPQRLLFSATITPGARH
jgi:superfamily II DNA helicase RecQ